MATKGMFNDVKADDAFITTKTPVDPKILSVKKKGYGSRRQTLSPKRSALLCGCTLLFDGRYVQNSHIPECLFVKQSTWYTFVVCRLQCI